MIRHILLWGLGGLVILAAYALFVFLWAGFVTVGEGKDWPGVWGFVRRRKGKL